MRFLGQVDKVGIIIELVDWLGAGLWRPPIPWALIPFTITLDW